MTKQNSEQELCGCRNTAAQCTGAGNCRVKKRIESVKPNQPDKGKELTSKVPYREAFQRGAASRDREIDELRAHIERLREALIETHKQLNIERGMKVEQAQIHAEVLCPKINPAQSLQAYHDSIVEKCASVADEYGHTDNVIARDIRELKEQK